jgi:tetratricopeptide (TPR) repeat protein
MLLDYFLGQIMRIKAAIAKLFVLVALLLCLQIQVFAAPIDEWQKLIQEGSHSKFDGQYNVALQSFIKALDIANNQKLPPKYLPISLCRVADVEVITNKIDEADIPFQKIIELFKQQKTEGTLDPQVSFWAAVLSDSYLSNTKPDNREKCLKRACYLKEIIYGDSHNECLGCLNKLAAYYIDQGKIDKAIRILTLVQGIADKRFGKNPDGLGTTLHQLALKCRTEHKYQQAKELELVVIKTANQSSTNLRAGLSAFYSFLGMNAFARGKVAEGQEYFSIAKKEALKAKSIHKKGFLESVECYRFGLEPMFLLDAHENQFAIEEIELKQLIAVTQIITTDPVKQVEFLNVLNIILDNQGKHKEAEKCLLRVIAITEKYNVFTKEIPEFYRRKGTYRAKEGKLDEAAKDFAMAIAKEKDKNGPGATGILLTWAYYLNQTGHPRLALEKLDIAFKQARQISAQKRGTLLADALQMFAIIASELGRSQQAQTLFQQSAVEFKAQKKLDSQAGPNLYCR